MSLWGHLGTDVETLNETLLQTWVVISEFHVWTLAQLRHLHGADPLERWNRGVISSVSRSAAGRMKHGAGIMIITGLADSWWQSMSKCWSLAQRGRESSAMHSIRQFWAVFLRLITVQTCNHLLYTFQGISTHPVEIHCSLTVPGLWFTVLNKYESPTQWMSFTGTSIKQLPQSGSFPWAFVELWSAERFSEELAK